MYQIKNRKIRRIMLIQPPAEVNMEIMDVIPSPPLGLAYLAGVMQGYGFEVQILDAFVEGWSDNSKSFKKGIHLIGLDEPMLRERIQRFDPSVVGISSMFTIQRRNAYRIAKICKDINPEIVTVFGGAHSTVMPEDVLSNSPADFVVLGEGEKTFLNLIQMLQNDSDLTGIDGIAYKSEQEVVIKPSRGFIEEIDQLPFPAMGLLALERYFGARITHGGLLKKKRYLPVLTSRGCPAQCVFCSTHAVWGKRYRARSPENIVEEILRNKEKFGIEEIVFTDDNLTFDKDRAKKIFRLMIDNRLNISWIAPNGVAIWTLDEEIIDLMKASGCLKICFPVESGDQHVLDHIIKKPVRLTRVKQLINYSRKIGLDPGMFLVVGLPGEKEDEIKRSFAFAKEARIYPFVSIATPYPGSELYDICNKKKYFAKSFSLDSLTYTNYNIETEDLNIAKLRSIIEKEKIKQRFYYYLNNPGKIFSFFKRSIFGRSNLDRFGE